MCGVGVWGSCRSCGSQHRSPRRRKFVTHVRAAPAHPASLESPIHSSAASGLLLGGGGACRAGLSTWAHRPGPHAKPRPRRARAGRRRAARNRRGGKAACGGRGPRPHGPAHSPPRDPVEQHAGRGARRDPQAAGQACRGAAGQQRAHSLHGSPAAGGGQRRRRRGGPRADYRAAAARTSSRRDLRRFVAGAGPPPDSARSRRAANRGVGRARWAGRRGKRRRPDGALWRPEVGGGAEPCPEHSAPALGRPLPHSGYCPLGSSLGSCWSSFPAPGPGRLQRAMLFASSFSSLSHFH